MKFSKFVFLICLLFAAAVQAGAPAGCWAQSKTPALSPLERAKIILEDSSGRYGLLCTRCQAAEELARAAAEQEPRNAEAWRLWGGLLEKLSGCAEPSAAWAREYGLEPLAGDSLLADDRGRELLRQALEKYQTAAQLQPDDPGVWTDWAAGLFKLARLEVDPEPRRRLVEEASAKYERAAVLRADDYQLWRDWALALMAAVKTEPEAGLWPLWLEEAAAKMGRSLELAPIPERALERWAQDWRSFWPESYDNRAKLYRLSQLSADKYRQAAELIPEAESSWVALGGALLENGLLEPEPIQAAAKLAEARAAFDRAGGLAFDANHFRLQRGRIYLKAARELAQGEQKEALIQEFLAILDNRPPEARAAARPLASIHLEEARLLMAAGAITGQPFRRRELAGRAKVIFQELLAQEPGNREILTGWSQDLLELASREDDPAARLDLEKEAADKWRRVVELAVDKKAAWLEWGQSLARQAGQSANPDWRRFLLKEAAGKFEQASQSEPGYLPAWAEWGRALLLLAGYESDPEKDWDILEAAVNKFERAANLEQSDELVSTREYDSTYQLAQLYAHLAPGHEAERFIFNGAMIAYKLAFSLQARDLDQSLLIWEIQDLDPENPASQTLSNETRQEALGFRIDHFFQTMPWANNFSRLEPWQLAQVAGLYRQAAAAALVSPELQKIYWRQSERLLRRAWEVYEKSGSPPAGEPERYDQSTVLSELGLALAEQSLIEPGRRGQLLNEAQKLWRSAENIRPGSSRYAQSRWAAWRGDWPGCRQYMRHNLFQAKQRLFPSYEEARLDPAFAEVKDEPWFSRVWLGMER